MIDSRFYAVMLDNGCGCAGVPDCESVALFSVPDEAVRYRDGHADPSARVYVVKPLPDSAHWDWSVDHGDGRELLCYVSEQAARNSRYGNGVVVRRRRGTSEWSPADAGEAGERSDHPNPSDLGGSR